MTKGPATCHPDRPDYARGMCHICYQRQWRATHLEQARAYSRERARKARQTPGYTRAKHLRHLYKLDVAQYSALLDRQDNACAICRQPFTGTPHVDHDHPTGRVRGLLCERCNKGIGYLNDDPTLLISAAEYCAVLTLAEAP